MIIVPATRQIPAVLDALADTFQPFRFVPLPGDDAYYYLLRRLWEAGETFTIVEHDIIVNSNSLDTLAYCANEWCACPYLYIGGWHAGLGCTRFRAELLARHPDVMAVVQGMSDRTHPPMHWCRLDEWIRNTLEARGERCCEQHPPVQHIMQNPNSSSHGCYTG